MILTYETIKRLLDFENGGPTGDWDWCSQYGEPGYQQADTDLVVLGYYWCRCGKSPHAGQPKTWGRPGELIADDDLHDYASHHPRTWAQLEAQGVHFEWHDEWTVDHNYDKAYRTQPDSYSWMPSALYDESGEILTADDGLEDWVERYLADNPRHCLPSNIFTATDLEAIGFVKHNGQFKNGWYHGQDDDPETITATIRADHPNDTIVFVLDRTGQFDMAFSAYRRPPANEDAT